MLQLFVYNSGRRLSAARSVKFEIKILRMFFNFFSFTMVKAQEAPPSEATTPPAEPKKLKPCCACPETKKPRDQCIIENGEANCQDLIEAHKACMRKMGFNI